MKIRTPQGQCVVCLPDGTPVIRTVGDTTIDAIRRMRRFVDSYENEKAGGSNAPGPSTDPADHSADR